MNALRSLLIAAVATAFCPTANAQVRIRVIDQNTTNRIQVVSKAPPDLTVLRWRNGEALSGELTEATASEVRWKSPLFAEPLVLAWPAVRRIDQTLTPVALADPCSVALRDGSHLYGELVAVTDQSVSIQSTRLGAVQLKRSEVLSVRRLRGGGLLAGCPAGGAEWHLATGQKTTYSSTQTPEASRTVPALQAGPGGALLLPYWNRGASLDLALPELVDFEFRVRFSTRPDFQLSLEAGAKQRLRLETWDEELVLVAGDRFKAIRKIAETEREVALRICWDRKTRQCSVFTPTGEGIAEWEVPEDAGAGKGQVVLQGKGRDLALELLRVRAWDDQPPSKLAGNLPRVELADGRIIEGQIAGGKAGSITVRTSGADPAASHPLSGVDALIFSTDLPQTSARETTLTFTDGTLLRGRIVSIRDHLATLGTVFTEQPLTAKTDGLRQLVNDTPAPAAAPPEPPLATLDTIVIQGATLHGRLAAVGDEQPRWLPIGGISPAPLAKGERFEITRAFSADAKSASTAALFFTAGGEVLPGKLRSLDRSGVEMDDSVFATTRLAADNLAAIVFGATTNLDIKGFDDPGWQVLRGNDTTVRKTAASVQMQPETALGHASLMQCSEIRFSITVNEGLGGARLRLFSAGDDRAETSNLVLANLGGRLYYGMEATEGQMDSSYQQTSIASGAIPVCLRIDDERVELQVNGVSLRSFPIPAAKRKGSGLVIKPANVFGNPERAITLSDFSAKGVPGRVWMPEVVAETRTQALTVPRFRRDDPPFHVLLAANGDVLRGEIEAATASHFGFRSGLENLRVPRERVKAAIWLKQPEQDAPPAAPPPPALEALGKKLDRQVRYSNAGLSTLIGVLQREAPGLKFQLPAVEESRNVAMQFGGQTVGEALDEICGLFHLRYRRADDGTIILEAGPAPARDLVEKVYWMKPDAFPSTGSAQEILVQKGVPFPAKSVALWQPNAAQLAVTNTPANHEKLAAVLTAEFGGSLGSPTHWLLLTSGARFGLAVEKFEPEFIVGRHPIYGRCRVPVAQVHIIRTTAPDPTPAMKSLQNWRLVLAPEPVLPETGGESSPSLGKPAKPFKLPLLGGGDFELAHEKGKVVVLDFWATWCGPCIKSLPALIEAMSAFPADRVQLVGVNQSEPAEQVKRFLATRGWTLSVALDAGQSVGRSYGVEGIPHTVIVGPDGNVAWVKTGYSPDGATEAANAVKQLLAAPAAAPK
jgi:thiol-disulfide isomerase/thioredoxin